MNKIYDTVIGLEVHIQLNTLAKAFCGDDITFGAEPNTQVSAISLALPGTLPVINHAHIQKAILLGLALGCEINQVNYFDRKHYFYPDSPKAYQITQDSRPICVGGTLEITVNGQAKRIRIHHIHMEEDAGKTIHDINPHYSLVDLNRAGTPLLELVTEPDMRSPEEVYEFISELQRLLRYLGVSDGDMEKGSLRADCNVSVKPAGSKVLGTRCEIKNVNSKKFARDAVAYEARRQIDMINNDVSFSKQTLHFNPQLGITEALRDKEDAEDYRYFPDPDLTPVHITNQELAQIKASIPQLPWEAKNELIEKYKYTDDYAQQLSQSPEHLVWLNELIARTGQPNTVANVLINNLLPELLKNDISLSECPLAVDQIAAYINLQSDNIVASSVATQRLWPALWAAPNVDPMTHASTLGLLIEKNQDFLNDVIQDILSKNPKQLNEYRKGKKALFGFFMGAVMRQASGADPNTLKKKLSKALDAS